MDKIKMNQIKTNEIEADGYTVQWKEYDDHGESRIQITLPFAFGNNVNTFSRYLLKDNDGNKYFFMPDVKRLSQTKSIIKSSFFNRPADALLYVGKGYADGVVKPASVNALFGSLFEGFNCQLMPVVFLDRNVGASIREKTLSGFPKQIKYKWALVQSNKNSFCVNDYYLRNNYKELGEDHDQFIFCGKEKFYDKIFLANTEEEILNIIPEVQYDSDIYSYKARQHILFEE